MSRTANLPIRTKRLTLRPLGAEDLPDLHRVYCDAAAMRYWSRPPHSDISETQALLKGIMASYGTALPAYLGIEHKGQIIGTAGVHQDDEIGFILHPDHWNKGLGFEAITALMPYLYSALGCPRLTADIDPRNTASAALLRKLGFTETGSAKNTFCINGEWSHSTYFARPRPSAQV
ncbi:GNAT family N-acetyltransferase [Alphaproteobacteria bacterium KMM 3653]|uniref:GNAT family N-acetyltransferase n=1 Tax=Harenicola maris TaxID=2841044 RepID=A0AAP2CL76_9RHOB|nr:GNAT family N-acetyltransferase [Harenicola maris]